MASFDPQEEVWASTRNSPGELAESPVQPRTVRETGRVSDRVYTRQHGSTRSPRPKPEGPTRDDPIPKPRTGTTQSEPSAPALAGVSSTHNEPGSPHTQHRTRNPKHRTPSEHTGERETGGPGRRTRDTTQRAGTPVNRSQVAQDTAQAKQKDRAGTPVNRSQEARDTAHATQHTERAVR